MGIIGFYIISIIAWILSFILWEHLILHLRLLSRRSLVELWATQIHWISKLLTTILAANLTVILMFLLQMFSILTKTNILLNHWFSIALHLLILIHLNPIEFIVICVLCKTKNISLTIFILFSIWFCCLSNLKRICCNLKSNSFFLIKIKEFF